MTGLAGSTWRFDDVAGVPVGPVPDRARPELTFEDDGQVFGTGGVNRLRGTYALDGDRLTFGPLVTTRSAGIPDHETRERAVLALLAGPSTVRVDGDVLLLVDPAGRPSHLARVDPGRHPSAHVSAAW
jgi:heat shock protein HslJ